ncbi:TVP38/TMEM64 family protein [Clostridium sardiniense]|uniref:TVP38/TMEM64 family protein n=1 Tax=Clostridium sardiniense TaxID=29369 RepID=UPI003D332351
MGKNKKLCRVKFVVFLALISMCVFMLVKNWDAIKNIDMEKISMFIEEKGTFSAIVYVLFYTIKPFFIIIPTNIIAIVGGTLFGPIKGFLLTMAGFWVSGTIAFYVSRLLGRDFVEGIIGNRFIKLDNNIEKKGFKILFLLRLPPILPYDPLSYACGFTKIKYKDFILASLLGVVPETMCYSMLGKSFSNPFSIEFFVPIAILVIGVISSKRIMNSRKQTKIES